MGYQVDTIVGQFIKLPIDIEKEFPSYQLDGSEILNCLDSNSKLKDLGYVNYSENRWNWSKEGERAPQSGDFIVLDSDMEPGPPVLYLIYIQGIDYGYNLVDNNSQPSKVINKMLKQVSVDAQIEAQMKEVYKEVNKELVGEVRLCEMPRIKTRLFYNWV